MRKGFSSRFWFCVLNGAIAFFLVFTLANFAGAVEPGIRINGVDSSAMVPEGEDVSIQIHLDPGEQEGRLAEWYLLVDSPFGWFSFVVPDAWQAGMAQSASLPMMYIESMDVPLPVLPNGLYTVYFGLKATEGPLTGTVWYDMKTITVDPALPGQTHPLSCPEIVQLASQDSDELRVAWLPSADDIGNNGIVYEVHVSTEEGYTPSSNTLYTTVSDAYQSEITGLEADTTYYVVVLAKDSRGNSSENCASFSASTFSRPVLLNPSVPVYPVEDLGLGTPEINGDVYTFPIEERSTLPTEDSLIVGESGFLRKVVSVTETNGKVIVQTTDAYLAEGVLQATVQNRMKLYAAAGEYASTNRANPPFFSTSTSKAGQVYGYQRWKDGFLAVEQKSHASDDPDLKVVPQKEPGRFSIQLGKDASTESEASFDTSVNFTPQLVTDIQWQEGEYGGSELKKAEVVAKGTLSLDAEAVYKFSASAEYEKEIPLFERTYTSVYSAGPVPVYQEITLKVDAVITATAASALTAKAEAHASATVSLGFQYTGSYSDPWQGIASTEYEKSLTAELTVQGEVVGEIRVVPDIEIRFYKTVSAGLSLEPYISGTLEAESVTAVDVLTGELSTLTQMKAFDFALGLEGFVHASVDILITDIPILSKTRIIGPPPNSGLEIYLPEYPLFDLPQLELSAEGASSATAGQPLSVTLIVDDGTNNPFDPDSLRLDLLPKDDGSQVHIISKKRATSGQYRVQIQVTPCGIGDHTLWASGYGSLGALARQYASLPITTTEGACELTAGFTANPEAGYPPMTVDLDGSASFDPGGEIASYKWSVSDGQEAAGMQTQITLADVGSYDVTLTVENGAGDTASESKNLLVKNCSYLDLTPIFTDSDDPVNETAYEVECIWKGNDGFYHYERTQFNKNKTVLDYRLELHKLDEDTENVTYNDFNSSTRYWSVDKSWYSNGMPENFFQGVPSGMDCSTVSEEMIKHVDTYGYPTAALWDSYGNVLQYLELSFDCGDSGYHFQDRPGAWQWNCNWSFGDNYSGPPVGYGYTVGANGQTTAYQPSVVCGFGDEYENCCPMLPQYCAPCRVPSYVDMTAPEFPEEQADLFEVL